MRTTVRLDDDLLAAAKRRALETGTTLTAVIEDALRRALRDRGEAGSEVAPLPTVKGATRAGVDLDDSSALLDLMSEP